MKILIYGINYSPEIVGVGKYSGEMGDWLVKKGHNVRVITAPPYYPDWQVRPEFSRYLYSRSKNAGTTIWRCPLFVPSRQSALLRIVHLASFAFSSIPILVAQLFWRPNIVFLIAPTLFCAPAALLFAKIVRAKSILHIQDFEADALFGLDLVSGSSRSSPLKNLVFWFESLLLRNFDVLSTISEGMMQRAQDKGVPEKCIWYLPNWSEVSRFQNVWLTKKILPSLGVANEKKVILYSGNMGEKQGLENVILAAKQLQSRGDLVFLLVGKGASKDRIIKMARDLKLANLIFAPLQSYEDFPSLLASANVHLVIQKQGVADAVLPSKLSNILAVGGNAVVTADTTTTLGQLPFGYPGIFVLVKPESVDALVSGIEKALAMSLPNLVALDYAQKFLDKEQVLSKFFGELQA